MGDVFFTPTIQLDIHSLTSNGDYRKDLTRNLAI
jgi:hypothetical protein